jgi:iron-sulfur cluster repair protein YtfE (RIC family)
VEEAKEHHRSELEPFELYAAKIRSKVHANVDEFRTRFAKGYHVLLEELGKEIKEV